MSVATVNEPRDERIVEEAHCTDCGVPITSIPGWYASVNVRFTCDSCRQKAGRSTAHAAPELDLPRATSGGVADPETEAAEPAIDEIDDVDLEIEDAEPEAETEAE